ncbi:hypothetical protein Y032_0057g2834 [Ancylostoma ceylanicum]|uniref:Uncharacterized protein n=1 Tax=Ancylostoma ceylanicum TaxID=53326 RepID=A0A016U5K6_9BILA|nr:hypothetical protein Y032_0057g2834 [Ancylostoma ceylanicum]
MVAITAIFVVASKEERLKDKTANNNTNPFAQPLNVFVSHCTLMLYSPTKDSLNNAAEQYLSTLLMQIKYDKMEKMLMQIKYDKMEKTASPVHRNECCRSKQSLAVLLAKNSRESSKST